MSTTELIERLREAAGAELAITREGGWCGLMDNAADELIRTSDRDALLSENEALRKAAIEAINLIAALKEQRARFVLERAIAPNASPSAATSANSMVSGVLVEEIVEMLDSYKYAIADCTPQLDRRCERFHYIPRIDEVIEALRKPEHAALSTPTEPEHGKGAGS